MQVYKVSVTKSSCTKELIRKGKKVKPCCMEDNNLVHVQFQDPLPDLVDWSNQILVFLGRTEEEYREKAGKERTILGMTLRILKSPKSGMSTNSTKANHSS